MPVHLLSLNQAILLKFTKLRQHALCDRRQRDRIALELHGSLSSMYYAVANHADTPGIYQDRVAMFMRIDLRLYLFAINAEDE